MAESSSKSWWGIIDSVRVLFAEEGNPDYEYIPAEVRDMSEEEAYMKLLTDQSREITSIQKARHAHTFIQGYSKDDSGDKISVLTHKIEAVLHG